MHAIGHAIRHCGGSLRNLMHARGGNIALTAAATLPIVVGALAISVDYASLALEKRKAQAQADLSAIVAAGNLDAPTNAVRDHFAANGLRYALKTETGFLLPDGRMTAASPEAYGIAVIETGRYSPDQDVPVKSRFTPTPTDPNAVRVHLERQGRLHFAASFADAPQIGVSGTAHREDIAGFSIPSRLVSVEGGVLNALLSSLFGAEITLSVMDYERLLGTSIAMPDLLEAVADDLALEAATYDEILARDVAVDAFADALSTLPMEAGARAALTRLAADLSTSDRQLPLSRLFDAGPLKDVAIAADPGVAVEAGLLDLISAAARIANGGEQLALAIDGGLPGIASANITLAIGEPPVGTAWLSVGAEGTKVATAQARLMMTLTLLDLLPGLELKLPLYLEAALAEAELTAIDCTPAGEATVTVEATSGLLRAAIGSLSAKRFEDEPAHSPITGPADLVRLPLPLSLLTVRGAAAIEVGDATPKSVGFSPADIRSRTVKTINADGLAGSLILSLIETLQLQIVPLPGLAPGGLLAGLTSGLEDLAAPLDSTLESVLMAAGIGLGQADIRVWGARCGRPLLVQ